MFLEEITTKTTEVTQKEALPSFFWPFLLLALAIIGGIGLWIWIQVRNEWYPLQPMNDKEFRKCYNIPEPKESEKKKKRK